MKKSRFPKTGLASAAIMFSVIACATPNLEPFADATSQLHTAVIQTDTNLRLSLIEAGHKEKAKEIGNQIRARITAMEAVVRYSDALANISDAGQRGGESAENLANALDGFLGAVSAPTMPASYVSIAKSASGIIASVRAAKSLAEATKHADPAIQGIAAIMIEDFDDLKKILIVTEQELSTKIVKIKENNDVMSYCSGLEKRRRQLESEITPENVDREKVKQLKEINELLELARDRYDPLKKELKDIEARNALQIQIVETSKKGLQQWAAIHQSLSQNIQRGLPPDSRLIASTAIQLRELIKKEDEQ
jgi:hypothetical protein